MSNNNELWLFSLSFYAKPKVKTACLRLQDNYDADINLLLFLLYQGSLSRQLSKTKIQAIDKEISSYRTQVIQPIRAIRKSLKEKDFGDNGALYKDILSLELDAEKLEQTHLSLITFEASDLQIQPDAAKSNLRTYAEILGIPDTESDVSTLLTQLGL